MTMQPDQSGHFGPYGGRFVPEVLMAPIEELEQAYLAARQRAVPGLIVDELDIWQEPLPEFDGDKAEAKMTVITGGELAGAGRTAWDEITEIAQRFTSADEYLFTVPMWNLSLIHI